MTKARKTSLDEWFLIYQLEHIKKHFFLPYYAKIDVTRIANHFRENNAKIPYTAILLKSASILIKENPEINRALFKTFYGPRIVEFDYNVVNYPVSIKRDGKYMLTGATIEDAYKKELEEIKKEIKKAANRDLAELPLNRFVHSKKNTFLNRLKLKIFHFVLYHFPRTYIKHKAGGIGVSSIMNLNDSATDFSMMAFGNTALTISSCAEIIKGEKTFLNVGIAFDHFATHGEIGTKMSKRFCSILQTEIQNHLKLLTK